MKIYPITNKRLIFVLGVLLLFETACAPSRYVKPLEHRQHVISGSFGGPMATIPGVATIPLPFTSLGYGYGVGSRMKLSYTRAMITAALTGKLDNVKYETLPIFDLAVPTECENVPTEILNPRGTWADKAAYDETANSLAAKFVKNFEKFAAETSPEILAAAPKVLA